MPPSSKVITTLPAYIRQEVDRRLFENGFSDYEGLARRVRGQGYEISDDSLWRYGRALREHLAPAELTVRHVRAQTRRGLGRLDHEGPDNVSSIEGAGNPARNGRGQTCRPECGRDPDQGARLRVF